MAMTMSMSYHLPISRSGQYIHMYVFNASLIISLRELIFSHPT